MRASQRGDGAVRACLLFSVLSMPCSLSPGPADPDRIPEHMAPHGQCPSPCAQQTGWRPQAEAPGRRFCFWSRTLERSSSGSQAFLTAAWPRGFHSLVSPPGPVCRFRRHPWCIFRLVQVTCCMGTTTRAWWAESSPTEHCPLAQSWGWCWSGWDSFRGRLEVAAVGGTIRGARCQAARDKREVFLVYVLPKRAQEGGISSGGSRVAPEEGTAGSGWGGAMLSLVVHAQECPCLSRAATGQCQGSKATYMVQTPWTFNFSIFFEHLNLPQAQC